MAITVTARNSEQHTVDPSTDTTFTGDTFTPNEGDFVIAGACMFVVVSPLTLTPTDTFGDTGGTAWAQTFVVGLGPPDSMASLMYRKIGRDPVSGAVTVTRNGGSVAEDSVCYFAQVSGVGLRAVQTQSVNDSGAPGATVGVAFSPPPGAASLAFGVIANDNSTDPGGGDGTAPPAGWTEMFDTIGAFGANGEQAYIIGGSATTPTWSSLTSAASGSRLVTIEISETVTPRRPFLAMSTMGLR